MSYRVTYSPRVRRELQRLPEKISTACVEFSATSSRRTRTVSESRWLTPGSVYYTARRADWRIIYRIDDGRVLVEVVTISHRSDAYRPR